ncbi:Glutamate receptor ionotropic, kainate 2 [Frankliniella fusca]|uniref:Glutamate receptor ionotropic, kainate 2 n=1 Tax=Frankliniella fusca TaxID=407009 RepID=A0AAE1GU72_9NEOP|nr:Glutamate receptor ionotropic, kainate 2 [Frankliniella fusca]
MLSGSDVAEGWRGTLCGSTGVQEPQQAEAPPGPTPLLQATPRHATHRHAPPGTHVAVSNSPAQVRSTPKHPSGDPDMFRFRSHASQLAVVVLFSLLRTTDAYWPEEQIRIGGLFHTMDEQSVSAFLRAIDMVNADEYLLPDRRLVGVNLTVPELDALQAHRSVCEMLGLGVAAVLGPSSAIPAAHIQSVLDAMEVPHLDTRPGGARAARGLAMLQVSLHPSVHALASVYADVLIALGWTSFTLVYAESAALPRLSSLLKMYDYSGHTVTLRQLPDGEDYRGMFKTLKQSTETFFVVDCPVERLYEVLAQLQQCGLLVHPYSFFFTSLDFATLDLAAFQYGGANITGLRLVNSPDPFGIGWAEEGLGYDEGPSRLQAALFHDGVRIVARALHQLQHLRPRPLDCAAPDSWEHGTSLINFIRTTEVPGMSGLIKFDHEGRRSQLLVEVLELTEEEGLRGVGVYNTTEGINMTRSRPWARSAPHRLTATQNPIFFNKTMAVLIAMTPPYCMLKEDSKKLSGNDRFEGFGIELIDELARMLGFNYTFEVQEDGDYGTCDPNDGTCSGMMLAVDSGKVDLAIVDLTITSDRESRVDFTTPFLSLGIQVLYRKPQPLPPSLMSFMSPFSNEVWLLMTAAYIGVSLLSFVMARISPHEWNNPYPCIDEPEELENQFSMRNAFWFTIGSIMQQGSEIAPIGLSTRLAASSWWLFTLIMVSSYTANLAAFLTVESQYKRISSAEDLAKQSYIKYGAKRGGSTMTFFKETTNPIYRQMYTQMVEWDRRGIPVLTRSNEEGLNKVAFADNYAFFMESVAIEYMMERNCNVTSVGSMLDEKGYGIAMAKNAQFRSALSAGVLSMQETGRMMEMKDKWWKNKRGGGACIESTKTDVDELNMDNVGGVFLVMVVGCILAVFVALAELALSVYRTADKENLSFREEMLEELKFIGQWMADVKPVRHQRIAEDAANSASNTPEKRKQQPPAAATPAEPQPPGIV